MLITLLYLGLISTSLTVQQPSDSRDIVVIGQRLKNAEDLLKACLARGCPPNEEIDASLALAETQIIRGDYKDARKTLLRALSRNKDEAKRYPIPISDLYRANGKVAAHLGYDGDYYSSTWGIYRTLKEGLPSEEARHFSALMEVAEMVGRTRGPQRAQLQYESIAKEARNAGRPDIAATAELRSYLRHYPPGAQRDNGIRRIADSTDPRLRATALEAKLILARLAFEKNDTATAQTLLQEFANIKVSKPVLIYAPEYRMVEQEIGGNEGLPSFMAGVDPVTGKGAQGTPMGSFSSTKLLAGKFDDMWIDVAFRITPDGKVADARILRSKGDLFWAGPLMQSIRGRRYTPAKENDPSAHHVERYTYTSAFAGQTGTRMMDRSSTGRVEYIDISAINPR